MALIKANNNTLSAITELPTGISGQNYPAFQAYLSSDQAVSDASLTKVQFDTEVFDTDNCYDNTTNYRFTPNVAGKYYVYSTITGFSTANNLLRSDTKIYKNGSNTIHSLIITNTSTGSAYFSPTAVGIIDMNGTTDYLESFIYIDYAGSVGNVDGSSSMITHFGAYRIGS